MLNNKYVPWIVAAGIVAGLAVVVPVFAAAQPGGSGSSAAWSGSRAGGMRGAPMMGPGMAPGVFGTVSSISGDTLTVTQKQRPNATTTTTTATVYTVDASSAKVMKNGTSSTLSAIATGDMVMVQGTVSGTSVTATVIRDGLSGMMVRGGGGHGMGSGSFGHGSTSTPPASPIQGNGEPVIGGSITAVNGNTVTVTNASNVTYTVDVSSAKIIRNGTTTAVSDLATGDNVVVQGTVNGTSVTASSVIDQGSGNGGTATSTAPRGGAGGGFLGAIGSFFKHIFGF